MINQRELAICKRRGHSHTSSLGWTQCTWCGMWLREVRTIKEREDTPPENEQSAMHRLERIQDKLNKPRLSTRGKKKAGKSKG